MSEMSHPVLEPEKKVKTRFAPRWQVLGIDDDITPMDYVVMLLVEIFHKSEQESFKLMMDVHENGQSIFYVGSEEACELKVEQVTGKNKQYQQVFRIVMEPIEDSE